jgi:hypothetical protein
MQCSEIPSLDENSLPHRLHRLQTQLDSDKGRGLVSVSSCCVGTGLATRTHIGRESSSHGRSESLPQCSDTIRSYRLACAVHEAIVGALRGGLQTRFDRLYVRQRPTVSAGDSMKLLSW